MTTSRTPYLGAYWGPRAEGRGDCTLRCIRFLNSIAAIDPVFQRWFKKGRNKREALAHPVSTDLVSMEHELSALGNDREVGGFSVRLWNGGSDDEAVAFSAFCGESSIRLTNNCLLGFPRAGRAAGRFRQSQTHAALLSAVVTVWDPDWATISSHYVREQFVCSDGWNPAIGWLMYFSGRNDLSSVPPDAAHVHWTSDGGMIVGIDGEIAVLDDAQVAVATQQLAQNLAAWGVIRPFTLAKVE